MTGRTSSTPLSWNDIRTRAAMFAREWKDAVKENAEAQTFWNEFFAVFGVDRKRVAAFEKKVTQISGASGRGRIDLLWPGKLLAEH
ncbi:MAG: type IIL restriction-modification enzyme MmeI, partial [Deinococcus sp.]